MEAINVGIAGTLNVWGLQLAAKQISIVDMFVSSVDGSVLNGIAAGWFVSPYFLLRKLKIIFQRYVQCSIICMLIYICPSFLTLLLKSIRQVNNFLYKTGTRLFIFWTVSLSCAFFCTMYTNSSL